MNATDGSRSLIIRGAYQRVFVNVNITSFLAQSV